MFNFDRPDLIVPYRKVPLRDRLYPYLLYGSIILATVIIVIMISMKGVR